MVVLTVYRRGARVAHLAMQVDGYLWTLCGHGVRLESEGFYPGWLELKGPCIKATCVRCKRKEGEGMGDA